MTFDELQSKYAEFIPADFVFGCGAGWIVILDRYLREVRQVLPEGVPFRLVAVTQRYGAMSIDASAPSGLSEDVKTALEKSELLADPRSLRTCETCGEPGQLRGTNWLFTACDQHSAGEPPSPVELAVFGVAGCHYVYDEQLDDLVVLT